MEPDEGVSLPLIHAHLMIPWNDLRRGDCCGRFKSISDGYFCKICDFFIHKECGDEISESIDHSSHPDHTLRLNHGRGGNLCDICRRRINIKNLFYRCQMCDFDVDLHCVKYPPPDVIDSSETHRHKLTLLKKRMEFVCDAKCGKAGHDEFSYKCHECDLNFHMNCVWHPAPELNHSTEIGPSPAMGSTPPAKIPPTSSQNSSPSSTSFSSNTDKSMPALPIESNVTVIDGVAKTSVPEELLKHSQPLWSSYIVGHFIGDAPHIEKVHATVNQFWASDKISKIDAQFLNPKSVLFKIEDSHMRQRVLRRQFWHIGDIPLVVQEWSPKTANLKPDLSSMPIWVDFIHVPDYLFSEKGLFFLGDIVGSAKELHPNTERCIRLDVARVLVVVNLEKPLPSEISLNTETETLISVTYPWLPSRCSTCNTWRNKDIECAQMKMGSAVKNENRGLC